MRRTLLIVVGAALALLPLTAAAADVTAKDVAGSRDHPLFTRMQGFHIYAYAERTFDRHEFYIDAKQTKAVEGHTYYITYWLDQGDGPLPSAIQTIRNHQNAIKKIGGTVVYDDGRYQTVMRVTTDGKEIWVDLTALINGNRYDLVIVEQEAMMQEIVANAEAWKGDLASAGHVAIYGITFDTDKAVIKPESEPVIAEMAKLLKDNSALNVFIVGHTDSTGSYEHNLKLSQERAAAVANALVSAHGIAAARMTSVGVGPVAPVAANDTEDGRAKNRRVELVKR
jgi:OmpA-OmpF porin, OOP family